MISLLDKIKNQNYYLNNFQFYNTKETVKQKTEKTDKVKKEEVKPNTSKVQETVFASLEEDDLSRQISEQLERERRLQEHEKRMGRRIQRKSTLTIEVGHMMVTRLIVMTT